MHEFGLKLFGEFVLQSMGAANFPVDTEGREMEWVGSLGEAFLFGFIWGIG